MKKPFQRFHFPRRHVAYRAMRRLLHAAWYGMALVGALLAVVFVAAHALLSFVTGKKSEIEAFLSHQSGYTVRIERLSAYWDGVHPGLQVEDIGVYAAGAERPALRLAELKISLQILPLFVGRTEIHSAVLTRPSLVLERLVDGRFRISGFGAIEQGDAAQNELFIEWLFRQDQISIEDGELQWFDRRESERLRLTHVNLELRNSGRNHRLGLEAEFPEGICGGCSFVADINGNPFLGEAFDGNVYLRARDVDVERMPRVIREHLPETLRGRFSVELWSEWGESRPMAVGGDVSVAGLRLPLTGLRAPLSVKQASTRLQWKAGTDGFQATLDDLTLALHGAPWSAGRWKFVRRKDEASLRVERIELADITAFIAGLRPTESREGLPYEDAAALWTALSPSGVVRDLHLKIHGALDAPKDYSFAADIDALALEPYGDWPGVKGAGGRVAFTPREGRARLDMRHGAFIMPQVFRAPIPVSRASADVRWEHHDNEWLVVTDNIAFDNEDGLASGRLKLTLPDAAIESPALTLNIDFRDASGKNAARYYPVRHLSPETLTWIEQSFSGGVISRGTLIYDGRTRDFPFAAGEGKFEIRARVRDTVYRYWPGWEPISATTADVLIEGERFLITGQGRIGALKADEVIVMSTETDAVRVRTNVSGPVAESLRVLREVKAKPGESEWKKWVPRELDAAGDGMLSLDMTIPLGSDPTRMRGEYRFLRGTLRYAGYPGEATRVSGNLRFTENGVREGDVRARLFGEETTLAISSPRPDELVALGRGRFSVSGLAVALGAKFAPRVGGLVPWEGRFRILKDRSDVYAEADLSDLKLSLPAPLDRPDGLGTGKLIVRTEATTRDGMTLGISAGNLIQGRVRFTSDDGWRLRTGRIFFNETSTPVPADMLSSSERGLHLFLRLGNFNLDEWLAYGGDDPASMPAWLVRVGAEIGSFSVRQRDFGRVSFDMTHDQGNWNGAVNGAAVAGRLQIAATPSTRIELDLARLVLPSAKSRDGDGDTDPRKLPSVAFKVRSFQARGRDLGEIDFVAYPVDQGWRIERAVLVRPESRLEVSGLWRRELGQSSSQFSLRFAGTDLGRTMEVFGVPDQVDDGELNLNARLSWNGAPADMRYPSLNGSVEIDAKKGRFLQLQQGAGRMFGLLDLSAIGRYLVLDFSPIFGKGFAFDQISGKVNVEYGTLYTDNFSIKGPSAKILVSGSVGLVAEDFHLLMDVYPSFSGSLTVTGLLAGGPQVALWTIIAQRLLKKQIEEGMRVTYVVNGPWSNPNIARKLVEGTTPEANAEVR